jgi:hypothetical protein
VTLQKASGTISRFVTWEPVRMRVLTVEDESTMNDLLQQFGVESIESLHGLEVDPVQGLTSQIERMLLEYDLGVLAHGYSPTPRSAEATAPESLLDHSVEVLQLSVRAGNCLLHAGIATVGELLQRSRADLMRLPNMGITSVAEIQQKLSELKLDADSAAPPTGNLPGSFSVAVLMPFETCGVPEKTAQRLRAAGFNDVHDLLGPDVEAIRVRAALKFTEIQALQTRLVSFRLRLGLYPPSWITEHLKELRTAFREDLYGLMGTEKEASPEWASTQSPRSAPTCLEEELEGLIPERVRKRRLPLIRRFLGWDGSTGTTLEKAGQEFDLTRERVRQIVSNSMQNRRLSDAAFLRRAIETIARQAPCSGEQAEAALLEQGLVRSQLRVESILATARALDINVPWQMEERNSFRVVMNAGDVDRTRNFHVEARRRISHFGATTKSYVLTALLDGPTSHFADLCCSLLADLKWLDENHKWFWLPTARNAVASRLSKILRVVPQLDIEVALAGVLRDRRMEDADLPLEIFRSFCNLIPWCGADEECVFARDSIPEEGEQDSNETLMRRILQEHGSVMRRQDLWFLASSHGIEKVSFERNLSDSNVLVRLAPEVYGLIGSSGIPVVLARPHPVAFLIEDTLQSDSVATADFEGFLEGCNPDLPDFPLQLLSRILFRSAPLRQLGVWSLVELGWAEPDLLKIRSWSQTAAVDFGEIRRQVVPYGTFRLDGAEAIALTFLACCSDIAMARADETEMWSTIQSAFGPRLRSQLFGGPGVPKARIREATERICSKLGIRQVFGREGEQSWRRTVFLQFGMTRRGYQRLPWWLTGYSVLPTAVEELLSSETLRSESFGEFWRTLQRCRASQLSYSQAVSILGQNPWVSAPEVDAVLSAALERTDVKGTGAGAIDDNDGESTDRLFGAPLLWWRGESPVFELPLRTRSRWLTEPRYVLVLHSGKRVTATQREGEYRLDGNLEVDLTAYQATVDLRSNQVSCLPKPLCIALTPEGYDFVFYDLANGELLPYGNEKLVPGHPYALLARSSLDATIEALEVRRVFDGAWILRAYRSGVPPSLEIRRDGQILWTTQDTSERTSERQTPKFQIACMGGRWGERATFTLQPISDLTPTHLLIDGKRVPLENSTGGAYRAAVTLTPYANYDRIHARVECILRNRVRWLGADLTMGTIQGIAIETEDGWKVLKETADMDAEYLRVHRIVTRLPPRFDGDDVSIDDWAWMEGSHFCGRPRTSANVMGEVVHAVGDPLRLSVGPYNRPVGGDTIARSVIHSGVVGWIEETHTDWQLQFRRRFELGKDHELWVWPSRSETPRVLDRSTWWQDDDVCHIRPESGVALVALAVSFKGSWLGARTSAQGWTGFRNLLRSCTNWKIMAPWLKWWRVPLLHPTLKTDASALAKAAPTETLHAWVLSDELSSLARFSEDYEDAWRSITRTFLWDWLPTKSESAEVLNRLGLLTGDCARDFVHSWEGYEDLLGTHPLLFVQLAARGVGGLYADKSDAGRRLLQQLRNQLLGIDPSAPQETVSRALRDAQQKAAAAMAVDDAFVARSLVPDAVALVRGNLERSHNLRVALANSYAVTQYLAATTLDKLIAGEIQ